MHGLMDLAAQHLDDRHVTYELDRAARGAAEALTITAPKSTIDVSGVHSLKSLLAKPVVVIIDTVLKAA